MIINYLILAVFYFFQTVKVVICATQKHELPKLCNINSQFNTQMMLILV